MNNPDQQLIEHFLREVLSEKEKKEFLERVKTDHEFRKKFLFEKQLFESLNENDWSFIEHENLDEVQTYSALFKNDKTKELRQVLKEVQVEQNKPVKKKSRQWLLYASAAAIAISLSVLSLLTNKTNNNELYANYLDISELPSLSVRGDNSNEQMITVEQLFKKKDYKNALPLLEKALNISERNRATLFLYKGISEMELKKYQAAETTFNTLINSELMDAPKGYWYKALLYLKMNNKQKSIEVLKEISTNAFYNHQKAKKLLKDLE